MKDSHRWARRILTGLAGAAVVATAGIVVAPAQAHAGDKIYGGTWDAPPTCFKDEAQAHTSYDADGSLYIGTYQYLTQETAIFPGEGGYWIDYIWVYEVSNPMMGPGFPSMQTVGFAKKVCGGEWITDYSNIA